MEMSDAEIQMVKTIIDYAKQNHKSANDIMWFLHSDGVKILIQQVMNRRE